MPFMRLTSSPNQRGRVRDEPWFIPERVQLPNDNPLCRVLFAAVIFFSINKTMSLCRLSSASASRLLLWKQSRCVRFTSEKTVGLNHCSFCLYRICCRSSGLLRCKRNHWSVTLITQIHLNLNECRCKLLLLGVFGSNPTSVQTEENQFSSFASLSLSHATQQHNSLVS
jgi:hypothetical protein